MCVVLFFSPVIFLFFSDVEGTVVFDRAVDFGDCAAVLTLAVFRLHNDSVAHTEIEVQQRFVIAQLFFENVILQLYFSVSTTYFYPVLFLMLARA
jgi:hypothetical protein